MFSVAPASVMLIGLLGLLIMAFATTRMALLERKAHRPLLAQSSHRRIIKSTV